MTSFLLSSLVLASQSGPTPTYLLTSPAVKGDQVVFSYAGDLWVSSTASGASARRLTSSPGLETSPKISPDGQTVTFLGGYEGGSEVYTIPMEGGEPKRLSYEAGGKTLFGFTPDGKSVAYGSAARNFTNRQPAMFLAPVAGGPAKPTVIKEAAELSYFPDGNRVAYVRYGSVNFNWRRYRGGSQGRVSIYDFRTNSYSELPAKREQAYSPMATADAIYYVSDRTGGTLNLFRYDLKSKRDDQLTRFTDSDVRSPSTDGKTVAYERDGGIYLYDTASKATTRLTPRIASESLGTRPTIKNLAAYIEAGATNDTGTRAYVAARGEIFSISPRTGESINLTNTSGARDQAPRLTPDGRSLVYLSDRTTGTGPGEYDVYVRDITSGNERALGISRLKPAGMTISPDGKTLAVSNAEARLYLVDLTTGTSREIERPYQGIGGFSFSPDSKNLAYIANEANDFGRAMVAPVAGGPSRPLTAGRFNDLDVEFDTTGKFLYLTSVRAIAPTFGQYEFSLKVTDATRIFLLPLSASTPNPLVDRDEEEAAPTPPPATPPTTPPAVPPADSAAPTAPGGGAVQTAPPVRPVTAPNAAAIDFEGAEARLIPLPIPPGEYGGTSAVPGGLLYSSGGTLLRFDLATKTSVPIADARGGYALSPKRTKLIFAFPGTVQILDPRPGQTPATGRVDLGGLQTRIDPRAEWRQIFWEVWRYQRDTFYDPEFAGQNWRAIGNRYAADVDRAAHRGDLTLILRRLVAELGTSHAYVQGAGDQNAGTAGPAVAYLGADYETVGGRVRFAKILRGLNYDAQEVAPLGAPGLDVKVGDTLLAIDGQPLAAGDDPGERLLGKAGRTVVLTVQSPGGAERRVRVVPTASEGRLRYSGFVEGNRRRVEEASNGRIGYFHVSDTAAQGSIDFVKGFYSQTDKDAVIVDERWNGGGYIQPWFVDTLSRRSKAYIQRPGFPDRPEAVAIEGPAVMLINGYAGSGGDFFPYLFRQAKRGQLIGTRTWGGLVGISGGLNTVDGQNVTSPGFAIYNPETNEVIGENQGIEPDIEVDARPDLIAQGRDPQLEKAIEVLQAEVRKLPAKKVRTGVPRLGPNGRVGG